MLIDHIVSWEGNDYALLSDNSGLMRLSNGQMMPVRPGVKSQAIGGLYAVLWTYTVEWCAIEVYSVLEPTKLFFTHRALRAQRGSESLQCGNETVLLENVVSSSDVNQPSPSTIKVIDAVSGFVLCEIVIVTGGFSVTHASCV